MQASVISNSVRLCKSLRTLPWKCRRLPEYDSLAPAQCKQACSLLMQLSEVLLNVYAAAIAEGKQGDLEAQYSESRDTLLGTLLGCASGWLQAGASYLGLIDPENDLEGLGLKDRALLAMHLMSKRLQPTGFASVEPVSNITFRSLDRGSDTSLDRCGDTKRAYFLHTLLPPDMPKVTSDCAGCQIRGHAVYWSLVRQSVSTQVGGI